MSTLARRDLRLDVIAALQTIAGLRVVSPGAWDSVPAKFPEAKVRTPGDVKTSLGRHDPRFTTTVSAEVQLHVVAATEGEAQDALETLCGQAEIAVLGHQALRIKLQQTARVVTRSAVDTSGESPIGRAVVTFEFETFESFDVVAPAPVPLTLVHVTADMPGDAAPIESGIDIPQ